MFFGLLFNGIDAALRKSLDVWFTNKEQQHNWSEKNNTKWKKNEPVGSKLNFGWIIIVSTNYIHQAVISHRIICDFKDLCENYFSLNDPFSIDVNNDIPNKWSIFEIKSMTHFPVKKNIQRKKRYFNW